MKGRQSWVGYIAGPGSAEKLPPLKPGILHPGDLFPKINLDREKTKQMNVLYAKDYSIFTDAEIVFKCWKNLDR